MLVWLIDDNVLHSTLFQYVCKELNINYKIINMISDIEKEFDLIDTNNVPDIIFIDLILDHGERGENLLKKIKERLDNKKNIKYIAFTADIIDERSLMNKGFDMIIYKPINKELLKNKIKGFINGFSSHKK
ncbi:conserved hypothetical protein [Deferribacter desulfuricans SSM1]|uniref:Response regulatory domain-containing protein n=1 Tax=Deferribacter desulfuricans (strain DSM 14783 / JCM 11476 / NBRC 101012 / SSM1) TaxID=639282 RepID=D3PDK1_DEFDS|nr:response regulator [Deferribacter desulfuricans]BAI80674.1 conserved hypothetical protein [Deferribacter desulfuricans SSM1]